MRLSTRFSTVALAAVSIAWTAPGETFDPTLAVRELPLDVVQGCVPLAKETGQDCASGEAFVPHWVGRSARGSLFLVLVPACAGGECRAWLVEKTAHGTVTLLALTGEFHLHRGAGAYPVVQTRRHLSDSQSHVARYEWHGGQYTRADSRLLYHVDHVECGSLEACRDAAREAMRRQQIDRALRIWERVHGVSWI